MGRAVSRRPLTAEAWLRSQVSPCEIRGGRSGTGVGSSPSTLVSLVSFIPLMLCTHLHLLVALTRTNGNLRKISANSETGEKWVEKYFDFSSILND
jgi:hypothetical protein